MSAGLATEGADVIDLGVLPTPGVATVAERRSMPGAMVSASHNPFGDNGIKLFSSLGTKLPVELESEVEHELASILGRRRTATPATDRVRGGPDHHSTPPRPTSTDEHLLAATEGRGLGGLHIVVDCANGAASAFAPGILAELGATVTTLCATPDGTNINDKCGSTDPGLLARTVAERGADLGLALDGDADRVVAVDHTGARWSTATSCWPSSPSTWPAGATSPATRWW